MLCAMRTARRPFLALLPLAALLLGGCATGTGEVGGGSGSPNRLTEEELVGAMDQSAMQAIRQLRPRWLRGSPTSFSGRDAPILYLDGVRVDLQDLDRIRTSQVRFIDYMSPTDATNRFGTNHGGGAILVTTR